MGRHRNSVNIVRARKLRKLQTDAEAMLWRRLRRRGVHGMKFRRQQAVAGFILDFFCEEAGLAIELDGGGHSEANQTAYDAQRTEQLEKLGIRVLRFWNSDVLLNIDGVLQRILEAAPRTPE